MFNVEKMFFLDGKEESITFHLGVCLEDNTQCTIGKSIVIFALSPQSLVVCRSN